MLQQKDIRKVLLAGAGVMGSSFAQIFAKHGYEVILYDIAERSLEKARGVISVNQEAEVASGELTAEESAALVERITMTTSKEYFSQADFVLSPLWRTWNCATLSGARRLSWCGRRL